MTIPGESPFVKFTGWNRFTLLEAMAIKCMVNTCLDFRTIGKLEKLPDYFTYSLEKGMRKLDHAINEAKEIYDKEVEREASE